MKIKYDQEVDVLVIRFSDAPIIESDELKAGVILDFDENDQVVKIEVLDASKRIDMPTKLEYELATMR